MTEVKEKSESEFREQVIKFLKTLPKTRFRSNQELALRGYPDLTICCRGKYIDCEIKSNSGVVAPLQQHELDKTTQAEGQSYLLRPVNFSSFRRDLTRLAKARTGRFG